MSLNKFAILDYKVIVYLFSTISKESHLISIRSHHPNSQIPFIIDTYSVKGDEFF